ncbi:ABC transporter substrate-binding protein [Ruania halotolerans]|uniref:ABC transporter substrate-binding protein n=1 Tax=Ruania halotolerans TaxID=2897773 RepID=UPI001E327F2C|nr:extracellular solute-binding protein [Ruania halotolerans]UFU07671.1 extracellular solute-binding protein [Ruania halotolerans]
MNPILGRRQVLAGGLASGAAVVGLSACNSGGGDGGGGNGTDVGTLQFYLSGDANQGGGYAHMAEKYTEETGVQIEIVDVANDDLQTRLSNAALANDLPALARIGAVDPQWKDATRDLAEIAEASGALTDLSVVDESGKVLSLPSDVTAVGLFLNKSLFDEAGESYPTSEDEIWTWDEFVATVKRVQEATGASFGMVMDRTSHRLKSFLYEFGSNAFIADENDQYQTNENTKPALEYFYGLNDDSFMPRSVWLSDGDPNALFKSGDVVSYYSGSWQIADFEENIADFEWVSVYLPVQPVRATNYGNAASIVVFEGEQSDAAYDFINWLYQSENYTELSETSGFLPAVEGVEISYENNQEFFDLYNAEIAASDPIVGEVKAQELLFQAEGIFIEGDPVRDEVVKYLNDEQDVDATIANINEQLTAALAAIR